MSHNILKEYAEDVNKLRLLGQELDLSEEQISQVIEDSFQFLETEGEVEPNVRSKQNATVYLNRRFLLVCILCILGSVSACIYQQSTLVGYKKSVNNYIERNVQELIYPGMKLLRKIMLPLVNKFPSLTAWYDETCLVSNPYFQVSDMECWPCENVRSVLNLTGSNLSRDSCHSGLPFVYKEETVNEVDFESLRAVYLDNKKMFDRDAVSVSSPPGKWQTIADLFENKHFEATENNDTHIVWRLIRLEPTRTIRQLFGYPNHIPPYTTGFTTEKYVLIDESEAEPYPLPNTEGSTVFVVQASGARMVVLSPAPECKRQCHRVSFVLQPQHILWYNWWYWRASSFPLVKNNQLTITYIGSLF